MVLAKTPNYVGKSTMCHVLQIINMSGCFIVILRLHIYLKHMLLRLGWGCIK